MDTTNQTPSASIDLSGVTWLTSPLSNNGGQCVQMGVAPAPGHPKAVNGRVILVRDSKDPDGPVLAFNKAELDAFAGGLAMGAFDSIL